MTRRPARAMILSVFMLFSSGSAWLVTAQQQTVKLPDPARFDKEISAFEKADARRMPAPGQVLFTGSSSMKNWHKELASDFNGLQVLGRGFGGSNMVDLLHHMDKVVIKYKPRAVVVYEGDNDLKEGLSVDEILHNYQRFYKRLNSKLPGCRLYVLSIKPSPSRLKFWPQAIEANKKLKSWCESKPNAIWVDVATCLLNEEEKPRPDFFLSDHLHLNRKGYEAWRDAARPVIMKMELAAESAN